MQPEDVREPSLNELCCLSVLGNVSYAIRCALRVRSRFRLPEDFPDVPEMTAVVDESLRWANQFVQTGGGDLDRGKALVEASSAVAEATYEETEYSAFAAHHAVRGAYLSAQGGEMLARDEFMEVVAAAYGASRVILANTPPWLRLLVVKSLRADYDRLAAMTQEAASQRGTAFDPSETGPLGTLWQGKTPTW
jgi:hypothetical protein